MPPLLGPYLSGIFIYPIKSLDGVAVEQATVLESGALKGDRQFAMIDYQGKFVNGKRTDAVHHLRASFDLANSIVSLKRPDSSDPMPFHLEGDRTPLESWLTDYFEFPIKVIQNADMGFPDDTASPGPTLISTETLTELTTWFPDLTLENLRQRLRTTLEISGAEAFWEDRLYTQTGNFVPFQIGNIELMGVNPCQRCIVPTRDPNTGQPYPNFQKIFLTKRKETLPNWIETSRFNHFYRLAINTRLAQAQARKVLQIGDRVRLGNGE